MRTARFSIFLLMKISDLIRAPSPLVTATNIGLKKKHTLNFMSFSYGDMYPKSPWGMAIAILAMFIGLFVIALPVIIVGGKFEEVCFFLTLFKHQREFSA